MNKRRVEKMAEEIRREISGIIAEAMKDPRLSLVSVSRVEVTNDLGHARILISVLGDEQKQEEAIQALDKAKGFVRTELSNRVRMRHAPEISFRLDKSIEHGIKINAILDDLKAQSDEAE